MPSRFVQRLAAVAGEDEWNRVRANGGKYVAWARALDQPLRSKRIATSIACVGSSVSGVGFLRRLPVRQAEPYRSM